MVRDVYMIKVVFIETKVIFNKSNEGFKLAFFLDYLTTVKLYSILLNVNGFVK